MVNYYETEDGKHERKRKCKFFETKEEAVAFTDEKDVKLTNEGREGAEFPTWLRVMAQQSAKALSAYGKTIKGCDRVFHSALGGEREELHGGGAG